MRHHIYNKVHAIGTASLLLLLTACQSDWRDGIPAPQPEAAGQEISFTAKVDASQTATRANNSLVNRLETTLPATTESRNIGVGVFGYYTGQYTWSGSQTANLMYNQRMTISAASSGLNALTYAGDTLKRFWPNNMLETPTTDNSHKYASFWGYYPYTATSSGNGSTLNYGINIFTNAKGVTTNGGMGTISFRMHHDAREQEDFMLSELVADCSKDTHPLVSDGAGGQKPKPVQLRFHHMLAQVRLYAFVRGADRMYYARATGVNWKVKAIDAANNTITLTDNKASETTKDIYIDASHKHAVVKDGKTYYYHYVNHLGLTVGLQVGDSIPDDTPWLPAELKANRTERWLRNNVLDVSGVRYRAEASYSMSFNNIQTQADFTPTYENGRTKFNPTTRGSLGSVTVQHYVMNPYWFRFKDNQRVMLNDHYMYGYYEDTDAHKGQRSEDNYDGIDWREKGADYLKYTLDEDNVAPNDPSKHFNYAPCNIILAVPQQLNDNYVPSVSINAVGKQVKNYTWDNEKNEYKGDEGTATAVTARVTINLLQMNIKWESGYIYCYAFLEDDLQPHDDKVRGPESITVVFDPDHQTDQW